MFDREQFMAYVGDKSGNSYASGLARIERVYSVNINEEYTYDRCTTLLAKVEADKKRIDFEPAELKVRSDMASHLKRYIAYKSGTTKVQQSGSWVPFYMEFADVLLPFMKDRAALLSRLNAMFQSIGMSSPFMERDKPMDDIDPFSVFGSFNKGISNERRIRILTAIAKEFGIKETVPSDFDGIPVLNNLKSFFFAFKDDPRRGERDIDNLWELFRFAIEYADRPNEQSRSYFSIHYDPVLKQSIIRWNITMGLFWIRPYAYINLDERNRKYLAMQQAFPPVDIVVSEKLKSVPSSKDYLWIIDECKKAMEHPQCKIKSFVELSDAAWKATTSVPPVSPSTDEKYWPALEEFNPNITKDDWKRFILEVELPNHPDPMKMLKGLMLLGGEATCKKLAAEYGGLPSRYVGCSVNIGKRAKKYFSLPTFMDGDQERFFIYPFLGRRVEENGEINYSYRIRPTLMDALQEIDLSAISPYASEEEQTMTDLGLNTILYGPPGTGKTYHTVIYAVAIIENRELASVEAESYSDVLARYNEYKAQGRIEFTTFHQSFGYEEFIEGIRPVVSGDDETSDAGDVQYSVQPGIFKRFCEKADDASFAEAWAALIDAAVAGGDQYTFTRRSGSEIKATLRDEEAFIVQWNGKTQSKNVLRKDKVLEQWSDPDPNRRSHLTGGNRWLFDAIQAVIDTMVQRYRLPTSKTEIPEKKNYVFIIDEINRGNISKIFGELITLIEESKRVGKPEGMAARLPYSQKPFGVPDNVYIIGTMNTADRSIATIDTALRRRFLFREMLPNPQVLADVMVEDLSISVMLNRMNQRIAVLYDREHTIGHTYFMKLRDTPTVETLAEIFRDNIIPLLQEYFYEDYGKIRLVLGDPLKTDPEEQFITACENDYAALFGSVDIGLDDSNTYEINDKAFGNIQSYRSI